MVIFWTREDYFKKIWTSVYWKKDCPFCGIEKLKSQIVWEWKKWFILHNIYPYSWNDKHLMATTYEHKKYFLDLNDDEILELKDIHFFIKNFYKENNYFSCTRETMSNRSIEHFHMHFLPWKLQWKYLRKMLMDQGFPIKENI